MSQEGGAVFISYAREDAAGARRIAEALRAHGIEAWLDESGLRGGDAWDAKIRKEIAGCSLFLAVISRHTQERSKGYFRLEWKLAVEQTHLLAPGVPFLVPIAVDETSESGAIVPPEFLQVHWTRLPGSLPTPQFVEQLRRLLSAPAGAQPAPARKPEHLVAAPRRGRARWIWAAAGLAAVLAAAILWHASPQAPATPPAPPTASDGQKSIAVLPFANMSADQSNGYFCDGIQEDILTDLANLSGLRVVSRTSVEQYRGSTKPLRQVARELNVAYVLEGSVQRSGNRVRVTGQLIDAAADRHLWAKAYDRDLNDIFAIQSELAQAIADALQNQLSPQEKGRLNQRPTANLDAYELVLRARDIRKHSPNSLFHPMLQENIQSWFGSQEQLLEQALKIDPQYVEAYADLAYVCAFQNLALGDRSHLGRAKEAIDRGLQIAPDSLDLARSLGDYYYYGLREFPQALVQYGRVVEQRPNDFEAKARIAAILRRQGRWTESVAQFRGLVAEDPGDLRNLTDLAILLAGGRRYDEAIDAQRALVDRDPDDLQAQFDLAYLPFLARGSTAEMTRWLGSLSPAQLNSPLLRVLRTRWALDRGAFDEALTLDRGAAPGSETWLAMAAALAARGDAAGSRARIGDRLEMLRGRAAADPEDSRALANLAAAEAIMGDKTAALRDAQAAAKICPISSDALNGASVQAHLAFVEAWVGERAAALATYARVLQMPFGAFNGSGGAIPDLSVNTMRHDLSYAPLREDPRFQALLDDPKNNAPLF